MISIELGPPVSAGFDVDELDGTPDFLIGVLAADGAPALLDDPADVLLIGDRPFLYRYAGAGHVCRPCRAFAYYAAAAADDELEAERDVVEAVVGDLEHFRRP